MATGAQGRELPVDKNLKVRLEATRMNEISQEVYKWIDGNEAMRENSILQAVNRED